MPPCEIRSLTTSDGHRLRFRHWPSENAECVVVALHGIQSHSQWYEYSSQRLASAGVEVYFADRRGSGLNGRSRGHADHGVRLINDVRQLIRLVRREQPGLKIALLGLSWGGKTAAATAAMHPSEIDRLVLLYPGLCPRIGPTWWQRFQLSFARRHDARKHPVVIPLQDVSLFTTNRDAQMEILDDPLALEYVTSGFVNAGRDLDLIVKRNATAINQPVLLMLSGKDRIVDNTATKQLVESFGTESLTTVTYPSACHTLEFDDARDEFVEDLQTWLLSSQLKESPNRSVTTRK